MGSDLNFTSPEQRRNTRGWTYSDTGNAEAQGSDSLLIKEYEFPRVWRHDFKALKSGSGPDNLNEQIKYNYVMGRDQSMAAVSVLGAGDRSTYVQLQGLMNKPPK